jgi:hypothetical protein
MKNKPDPALLRPLNLSNEIKKGSKISWDYPFKYGIPKEGKPEQVHRTLS